MKGTDISANNVNDNIIWSKGEITYEERCKNIGQRGLVIWLTGLSGSGKSTIAKKTESELIKQGRVAYRLDGDNLRYGLNSDLGFTQEERKENIRRVAEVAALFKDAGIITLVSSISPYIKMRELARQKCGKEDFIEVYIKADIKTCISRDPKGLYKKAIDGEIKNFTGISSPYEEPNNPDLVIDTSNMTIEESVKEILHLINNRT